jgi:hypothetical protein
MRGLGGASIDALFGPWTSSDAARDIDADADGHHGGNESGW